MLENLDKIMHLHFSFDACPMHSPFGFVHLTHQNLSARALFCLNSLAKVNTQLLIYNYTRSRISLVHLWVQQNPIRMLLCLWYSLTECMFDSNHCQVNLYTLWLLRTTDRNDHSTKPMVYHKLEQVFEPRLEPVTNGY